MNNIITSDKQEISLKECVNSLNKLLKLRTIPIGMKLFPAVKEMESVEKIRRRRNPRVVEEDPLVIHEVRPYLEHRDQKLIGDNPHNAFPLLPASY